MINLRLAYRTAGCKPPDGADSPRRRPDMALHRLTNITIGVPDVAATAAYYAEFGLMPAGGDTFATADGGEQLRLVFTPTRRLVELGVGVDDPDDIERIARQLSRLDLSLGADGSVTDPG